MSKLERETEWVEFKVGDDEPNSIGQYISALAYSAVLHSQNRAYLVFGINDGTHELVGTEVRLVANKVGNEEIENWILRKLNPRIDCHFQDFECDGRRFSIVVVQCPSGDLLNQRGRLADFGLRSQ
ncbi:MAG: ATP-binding protein, partial [Proteobacteria bacterium]|nr:ATP-binding protein [Pseudomonadota bacterium]